jgi:hypothetical protein
MAFQASNEPPTTAKNISLSGKDKLKRISATIGFYSSKEQSYVTSLKMELVVLLSEREER